MENIRVFAFADESDITIDGQISALKRNNLSGIEMRNVDGIDISDITIEKAKEVYKKFYDSGLSIWSLGSPIGKINIKSEDFNAHIDKFKHTLEIANILNAQNIRLFSFYIDESNNFGDFKNEVIEKLGIFVEIANDSAVTLCHENERGIYGNSPYRCLEIHKALPEIKCIFDPANYVQFGCNTIEAWNLLKSYVAYMHIKDALQSGMVVPAGEGIGNIKEIVNDYIKLGGKEFTIEPHLAVGNNKNTLYASKEQAFDVACKAFKEIIM